LAESRGLARGRSSRREDYAVQFLIVAAFTAFYVALSRAIPVVALEDSFDFISRARSMKVDSGVGIYVDGYYPLGYPVLLNALFAVLHDYLLAAKTISIVSASLLVVCFYRTARMFSDPVVAALSTALLALNQTFVHYAATDNTDLPATALAFVSVYVLIATRGSRRHVALAGALLGGAYLIRYTSLAILPVECGWLLLADDSEHRRGGVAGAATLGLAFLLVASPQLAASFWVKGNPFFNTQAANVWFGLYGGSDWAGQWMEAQQHTSLREIVALDPSRFVRNLAGNVGRVLFTSQFAHPLFWLSIPGAVGVLLSRRDRRKGLLIVLTAAAFALAISMAFVRPRLLLFVLVGQALLGGYGAAYLLQGNRRMRALIPALLRRPLLYALLAVALMFVVDRQTLPVVRHPMTDEQREIVTVAARLDAAGLTRGSQVLSFSFRAYRVSSPFKEPFELPWYWQGRSFGSGADIKDYMRRHQESFLVYDRHACEHVPSLCRRGGSGWSGEALAADFETIYRGEFYTALKLRDAGTLAHL
jgi:4-amino-4-deoxy-L-arabinose transferase-like glycosyltransferase